MQLVQMVVNVVMVCDVLQDYVVQVVEGVEVWLGLLILFMMFFCCVLLEICCRLLVVGLCFVLGVDYLFCREVVLCVLLVVGLVGCIMLEGMIIDVYGDCLCLLCEFVVVCCSFLVDLWDNCWIISGLVEGESVLVLGYDVLFDWNWCDSGFMCDEVVLILVICFGGEIRVVLVLKLYFCIIVILLWGLNEFCVMLYIY